MTKVALASKQHWGYPDEWMALWVDELTITPQKLDERDFFVGKNGDEIVFLYSISQRAEREYELEDCWVAPEYIGHGFGQLLFDDLKKRLRALGCSRLKIISDPNAAGFYRKMGAVQIGEEPTKIEGRVFPVFEVQIAKNK
ncbi:MAG: GNAT family N-acetyltransferase [Anaerolineae bacterium]|nr:GNAT family N-acetyltransferase [Anaerolineae bacterium]MBT7071717.1 GNAT family N-acetyltransferase [Anaerolineae bacterium]MBT7325243.1 GNAT family N-acetyltransferase [Anaerolineae bacterium]